MLKITEKANENNVNNDWDKADKIYKHQKWGRPSILPISCHKISSPCERN